MSDYLFSPRPETCGTLARVLGEIYTEEQCNVREFHGEWGSLAVTQNLYNGFQPYEDVHHILVVVGGPVLKFTTNEFVSRTQPNSDGTKKILDRWLSGKLKPEDDLSGPFSLFFINKQRRTSLAITDLMSFVSIWKASKSERGSVLSTHPDVIARLLQYKTNDLDPVAISEFILSGVVTYPYSVYKNIKQLPPASYVHIGSGGETVAGNMYYYFDYVDNTTSVTEFGNKLHDLTHEYITGIATYLDTLALFISGGEDSRAVLSFLPKDKRRFGVIFLDQFNREGRIAKKAANAYGADFKWLQRERLHYLKMISPASRLVGSGGQFIHAHSYLYAGLAGLQDYAGVFGGFAADRLLKGQFVRKARGLGNFPFLPQLQSSGAVDEPKVFVGLACGAQRRIKERRAHHLAEIRAFRSDGSAEEWTKIWPASMAKAASYGQSNRRLFKSYEPFLDNEVVKLAAKIPVKKKLNRRVFHNAMKKRFGEARYLRHANGWYPYLSKWQNMPFHAVFWFFNQISRRANPKRNQGPWCDWEYIQQSSLWESWQCKVQGSADLVEVLSEGGFLRSPRVLSREQQVNVFQVLDLLEYLNDAEYYRGA